MNKFPRPVRELVSMFERLPGIGPKTAIRLTFYLFQTPPHFVQDFARAMVEMKQKLKTCSICYNIDETDPCRICRDNQRDKSVICVVEKPLDILAIEETGSFKGVYHVLGGVINPLLHIGPDDLFIAPLLERVKKSTPSIKEVIIATDPTMEGEATALYLKKALGKIKPDLKISRIGHGLPMGADLDYADPGTLAEALKGRRSY
ncbi:recombination protein RecR [bacterium]|nr:recombination protein RecR [bacterium]